MKEFMFFIRKQVDSQETLSPVRHFEFLKSCESYIGRLKQEGRLISAQPITRAGSFITCDSSGWHYSPVNEYTEVIGGYYHIKANDMDEAMEIAKANPEFTFNPDTRIEVRPIKTKEKETGFVYPKHQEMV